VEEKRMELKGLIDDMPQMFERLKALLLTTSDAYNEVLLQESRFNENETERLGGRVSFENAALVTNQVRQACLLLIDNLRPTDLKEKPGQSFHEYHSYTCDRVEQSDRFKEILISENTRKNHYFYLYGFYLQSHKGLFKRIAYELEGRLRDVLNPNQESGSKTLQIDLPLKYSNNVEVFKLDILKDFFTAFGLAVNECEPLLEKNLAWLRQNSPALQGYGPDDYVCVFVSISEWDWDKKITPEITRWMIQNFCEVEMPADSPSFLFFFAVSYEDENSPVEQQVEEVISKGKFVVGLPELNMVPMRDIASWFNRYSFIRESARDLVALRNQYFANAREHYMDDVETVLRKIIDEYNQQFFS